MTSFSGPVPEGHYLRKPKDNHSSREDPPRNFREQPRRSPIKLPTRRPESPPINEPIPSISIGRVYLEKLPKPTPIKPTDGAFPNRIPTSSTPMEAKSQPIPRRPPPMGQPQTMEGPQSPMDPPQPTPRFQSVQGSASRGPPPGCPQPTFPNESGLRQPLPMRPRMAPPQAPRMAPPQGPRMPPPNHFGNSYRPSAPQPMYGYPTAQPSGYPFQDPSHYQDHQQHPTASPQPDFRQSMSGQGFYGQGPRAFNESYAGGYPQQQPNYMNMPPYASMPPSEYVQQNFQDEQYEMNQQGYPRQTPMMHPDPAESVSLRARQYRASRIE